MMPELIAKVMPMYQDKSYQPAPEQHWGSDPLVVTSNIRRYGVGSRKPKLWGIIGVLLGFVAVIGPVVAVQNINHNANSRRQVEVPPQLVEDLPPPLASKILRCYMGEIFLGAHRVSGAPQCMIDRESDENVIFTFVYYLDSAKQVAAMSALNDDWDSRDLSNRATTGAQLVMHSTGDDNFYVVNVMAPDRAYVLSFRYSPESEVMMQLEQDGVIKAE